MLELMIRITKREIKTSLNCKRNIISFELKFKQKEEIDFKRSSEN